MDITQVRDNSIRSEKSKYNCFPTFRLKNNSIIWLRGSKIILMPRSKITHNAVIEKTLGSERYEIKNTKA